MDGVTPDTDGLRHGSDGAATMVMAVITTLGETDTALGDGEVTEVTDMDMADSTAAITVTDGAAMALGVLLTDTIVDTTIIRTETDTTRTTAAEEVTTAIPMPFQETVQDIQEPRRQAEAAGLHLDTLPMVRLAGQAEARQQALLEAIAAADRQQLQEEA
ncbi:hypothetical protein B4Q04_11285 [Zobellia sp. OII3]|nr:hypothetical protein B4Q04_11285 [Zobellia sp. OII3]